MQNRFRRLEGADQIALFGGPAARGWLSRIVLALGALLRSALRA